MIVTHSIEELITTKQQRLLLNLGTTSRDMVVHLETYKKPDIYLNIRRAKSNDRDQVIQFARDYFSEEWANTINEGLLKDKPSIYIAFNEVHNVSGFAAFDVYQGKKNYFGPMGVLSGERTKGIGFSLLHSCLSEMKEIGYGYAIIGGASPLEFYETVCNAVVIPYPYEEWDG